MILLCYCVLIRIVLSLQDKSLLYCSNTLYRRGATRGGGGGGGRAIAPAPPLMIFVFFLLVSSAVSHVHDDNTPTPL